MTALEVLRLAGPWLLVLLTALGTLALATACVAWIVRLWRVLRRH